MADKPCEAITLMGDFIEALGRPSDAVAVGHAWGQTRRLRADNEEALAGHPARAFVFSDKTGWNPRPTKPLLRDWR
jgi:hypothetical protein